MRMFAQFFGGEDPFTAFFNTGGSGIFTTGGTDDFHLFGGEFSFTEFSFF